MTYLNHPSRLVLYEYPHRCVFVRDGNYSTCLYCGASRPHQRFARSVRIAAGVLAGAAVGVAVAMGVR